MRTFSPSRQMVIGPHEVSFGQLLYAVSGEGWVAGETASAMLREGEAASIRRGDVHSKGSDTGLAALMARVRDLDLRTR
jgi:quercetin dioxygenase-like cupin family protein